MKGDSSFIRHHSSGVKEGQDMDVITKVGHPTQHLDTWRCREWTRSMQSANQDQITVSNPTYWLLTAADLVVLTGTALRTPIAS